MKAAPLRPEEVELARHRPQAHAEVAAGLLRDHGQARQESLRAHLLDQQVRVERVGDAVRIAPRLRLPELREQALDSGARGLVVR